MAASEATGRDVNACLWLKNRRPIQYLILHFNLELIDCDNFVIFGIITFFLDRKK